MQLTAATNDSGVSTGQTIGSYKILKQVGVRGLGMIYQAADQQLLRSVAIKVLLKEHHQNLELVGRFRAEPFIANQFSHPCVVQFFSTGRTSDGGYFHAMEWVEGQTLTERLMAKPRTSIKLGFQESLNIAWQVACVALWFHERGIIHGDIAPANIMLVRDERMPLGEGIKVLDFICASLANPKVASTLDKNARLIGLLAAADQPDFMVLQREPGEYPITPQADVYSLGCLLFKMLLGEYPCLEDDIDEQIFWLLYMLPPLLHKEDPSIPVDISTLVNRMLAKVPDERPTMSAVRDELARMLGRPIVTTRQRQ